MATTPIDGTPHTFTMKRLIVFDVTTNEKKSIGQVSIEIPDVLTADEMRKCTKVNMLQNVQKLFSDATKHFFGEIAKAHAAGRESVEIQCYCPEHHHDNALVLYNKLAEVARRDMGCRVKFVPSTDVKCVVSWGKSEPSVASVENTDALRLFSSCGSLPSVDSGDTDERQNPATDVTAASDGASDANPQSSATIATEDGMDLSKQESDCDCSVHRIARNLHINLNSASRHACSVIVLHVFNDGHSGIPFIELCSRTGSGAFVHAIVCHRLRNIIVRGLEVLNVVAVNKYARCMILHSMSTLQGVEFMEFRLI